MIRAERKQMQSRSTGQGGIVRGGNAEVVALAEEGDDAYVRIRRKSKEGDNEGEVN